MYPTLSIVTVRKLMYVHVDSEPGIADIDQMNERERRAIMRDLKEQQEGIEKHEEWRHQIHTQVQQMDIKAG